jgi:hypothetical protein
MGSSSYSDHIYTSTVGAARAAGVDPFAHTTAVRSGKASYTVHDLLDPKRLNKAGQLIRESRDSDAHPNSVGVAVLFDVTGSMSIVPRTFVDKLPKLMASLVKKGYLADPHVLFGAVGDATCDRVPLQIGQFEAGNEMDTAVTNILLEGGGGGQTTESYELGMYFMARKASMDCFEKRGKKGYLFLIGDENPYPRVKRTEVKDLIGDDLQEDIPTEAILKELQEKFEVFWIMPGGTQYWGNSAVEGRTQKLFGQNFLRMPNPEDVCELIVSTIGVCEGYDIRDIARGLKDVGADADAVDRATTSLVPFTKSNALVKRNAGTVDGSLATTSSDSVARL